MCDSSLCEMVLILRRGLRMLRMGLSEVDDLANSLLVLFFFFFLLICTYSLLIIIYIRRASFLIVNHIYLSNRKNVKVYPNPFTSLGVLKSLWG